MVTEFQQKVYDLCRKIPHGKVTTYREIGNALGGRGQVYRAIGVALNKNPFAPEVPCHRVVNSDGFVGGFARGTKKKIELLQKEGIEVNAGKIALKKFLFRFVCSKTKMKIDQC